jgi:beta-lactam-binding protein with PASTA domain
MPDLTNLPLEAAIEIAQSQGLDFTVVGRNGPSPVVVRQSPPPGTFVPPGTEVQLITGPTDETVQTGPTYPIVSTTAG